MTDAERIATLRQMTGKEPTIKKTGNETMQQMYGVNPGQKCRNCRHIFYIQHEKRYYKCGQWKHTLNKASNIQEHGVACMKFEAREGGGPVERRFL